MKHLPKFIRQIIRFFAGPLLTVRGFLVTALFIAIAYFIVHTLGLRQYTMILSGTLPGDNFSMLTGTALGTIYIVLYFSFVLVCPILILAAVILLFLSKLQKMSIEQ